MLRTISRMTGNDLKTQDRIAAESSRLHRLFTLGAGRVSLTGETLHIEGFMGGPRKIPVGAIDSITVQPSWFWHRLTIRLGDGTERSIGGLDEKEAVRVRDAAIEGAVRVAKAVDEREARDLKRRFDAVAEDSRHTELRRRPKADALDDGKTRRRATHDTALKLRSDPTGVRRTHQRASRPGSDRDDWTACSPRIDRGLRSGEAACEQPLHLEERPYGAGSRI